MEYATTYIVAIASIIVVVLAYLIYGEFKSWSGTHHVHKNPVYQKKRRKP